MQGAHVRLVGIYWNGCSHKKADVNRIPKSETFLSWPRSERPWVCRLLFFARVLDVLFGVSISSLLTLHMTLHMTGTTHWKAVASMTWITYICPFKNKQVSSTSARHTSRPRNTSKSGGIGIDTTDDNAMSGLTLFFRMHIRYMIASASSHQENLSTHLL